MSSSKGLVIWGASGHALVVADIIRLRGEYEIVGFIDSSDPARRGSTFCGAPVLGGEEQLGDLARLGVEHLIFGFGDCAARLRLGELVRARGFRIATAIHPRAVIAADASVGEGTVVAAGAVVNPGARIGEDVIINTAASIDHECVVEDGAHVSPGVRLAGRVSVGRGAWIGIGAVIIGGVRIGAGALIGAGAVVLEDVPDGVLAYGVPARVRRKLAEDD
ncbi:MAG TPA: NeuD/PglB/VioB family sugar acetyltransferase [Pyrinomonadaceae bacterium]|jgi:acetyltransferase EpsM|nr:NeuD/PglB/VioB family sugar acetyltransferase [Pyrinomonadaceae bacterium]